MEVLVLRREQERAARVADRIHDEGDVPGPCVPALLQPHPPRYQERQHPRGGGRDRQDCRLRLLRAADEREPVALVGAGNSILDGARGHPGEALHYQGGRLVNRRCTARMRSEEPAVLHGDCLPCHVPHLDQGDPWARQSGEVEQGSHQFRQGVLASTRVPPFFYSLASPLLSPCPSHSRFTSLQVDAKHRMSSSEALDHP
mmetsp:Transcript_29775/g.67362  ORF Transcript_29775/g.67362 Transcript_29775/m.67362 type:complete len:201 (+) Transcript_29775:2335-2937(+)